MIVNYWKEIPLGDLPSDPRAEDIEREVAGLARSLNAKLPISCVSVSCWSRNGGRSYETAWSLHSAAGAHDSGADLNDVVREVIQEINGQPLEKAEKARAAARILIEEAEALEAAARRITP